MSGVIENWNKVVIWGAALSGSSCMVGLKDKNIETLFFVDKYPQSSREFKGKYVHSSDEIFSDTSLLDEVDAVILTMGAGAPELKQELRKAGVGCDIVTYRQGLNVENILSAETRVIARHMLSFDSSEGDLGILANLEKQFPTDKKFILYGAGTFSSYVLRELPSLKQRVLMIVDDEHSNIDKVEDIDVLSPNELSNCDAPIVIACTTYLGDLDIKHRIEELRENKEAFSVYDYFSGLPHEEAPAKALHEPEFSIYPIDIPPIRFEPNKDMLLLDLPGRMLGMLPNGLGYVHNMLKSLDINFQTLDLDLIIYHRYHSHRILDNHNSLTSPSGREMPSDPWAIAFIEDSWKDPDFICFFDTLMESIALKIIKANPKVLGFSLNGTNTLLVSNLVKRVKKDLPNVKVIVGGYECINPEVGPKVFDDYDYMVIFEAEGSLPYLVEKIMNGEKVINLPGVISKDEQMILGSNFTPAELENDLDKLGYPTYEWADIRLYKNYNGYQLVPILLSRGCRWSKCTFCGERFSWRRRSAQNLVDEIEFLVSKGCNNFHFNDSDLSGDPAAVREICEEIIKRGIKGINMAGQLRVQKGYTPDYFDVLKEAGFNYLRYGIDGWSRNTLRLHKKGYNSRQINELIKMTKDAGILVSINLVLGIPHETEEDIDETIQNIIENAENIDTIENINTLMLIAGSVYWEKPEELGIRFKEDKEKLFRQFPKYIPYKYWHSVEPYIDQDVRLSRLNRVLEAASSVSIRIGSYAEWSSQNATKI